MSALIRQPPEHAGRADVRWHRARVRTIRSILTRACALPTTLPRWLFARRHPDYVIELIPPRAERREALDALALENVFQSLLLTARDPIALEVYGAPHERRLLARTRSLRSLAHLCAQLRVHAPHIEARWVAPRASSGCDDQAILTLPLSSLADDPLSLRPGERLRSLELCARGGAHLPLKLYEHEELGAQGVDPMLERR